MASSSELIKGLRSVGGEATANVGVLGSSMLGIEVVDADVGRGGDSTRFRLRIGPDTISAPAFYKTKQSQVI